MKLLLLTDIPPCSDLTAGLVLGDLCRHVPKGGLACFTVLNDVLNPKLYEDLDWMPLAIARKPNEIGNVSETHPRRARLRSFAAEVYRRKHYIPSLVEQAVSFGKSQGCDTVWAVLQGQTMVRMAMPVAKGLGAKLYTHVWDPLGWWLQAHLVDKYHRKEALAKFDATIRASEATLTASWAMADHYEKHYGTRSVPVISAHPLGSEVPAATWFRNDTDFVIGMVGQFYASEEWWQLVTALNIADWKVAGRNVRLKVLSHQFPYGHIPADKIDFLGFRPQTEVIRILSQECDAVYCPYPFKPEMEETARLSFPSKLVTYLAAGRPIIMHGPKYASPTVYLSQRGAAVICDELDPPALYNALERLATSPELYARAAGNGGAAFYADFTHTRQKEKFFEFLGATEDSFPLEVAKPSSKPTARHYPAQLRGVDLQKSALKRTLEQQAPLVKEVSVISAHYEQIQASEHAKWTTLVAELTANEQFAEQKLRVVTADLQRRTDQVAATETLAHSFENEGNRLNQRSELLSKEVVFLKSEFTRMSGEVISLQQQLNASNALTLVQQDQLIAAHTLAQSFENESSQIGRRAAQQLLEIEQKTLEISTLQYEITQLHRREQEVTSEKTSLFGTMDMLRGTVDILNKNITQLESDIKTKNAECEALIEEISSLKNTFSVIENNMGGIFNDQDNVEYELKNAEDELKKAETLVEDLRRQNADLQGLHNLVGNQLAGVLGKLSIVEYKIADTAKTMHSTSGNVNTRSTSLYLDLMESSLTGSNIEDDSIAPWSTNFDPLIRSIGRDWPSTALTMIGTSRMRNLRHICEDMINQGIPGDFIETGVWRGGACVYMRAILAAYGDKERTVWVADSFEGLPPPNEALYPADQGDQHHNMRQLAISVEDVKAGFARYELLDDQVKFLKGWFKDTLPTAPIEKLAVLRLDGDMYESTIQALDALYSKVSVGGAIIVDDYLLPACKLAIEDFRRDHNIADEIFDIDGAGVYWIKSRE